MNDRCRDAQSRYARYIASAAWRKSPARLAELEASGRSCRLCSRSGPEVAIEVHHNNYRRLGREVPSDLCALCSDCHRLVTGEMRRRRHEGQSLPAIADVRRMLPGRRLPGSRSAFEVGVGDA